jgi:hypothetical protein
LLLVVDLRERGCELLDGGCTPHGAVCLFHRVSMLTQ